MAKHPRKKQKLAQQVQPLGSVPRLDNDDEKDDEERKLESILFGKAFAPSAKGKNSHILLVSEDDENNDEAIDLGGGHALEQLKDTDLFFVDDARPDVTTEVPDFDLDVDSLLVDGEHRGVSNDDDGGDDEDDNDLNDESQHQAGSDSNPSTSKAKPPPPDTKPSQVQSRKKAAWADPDDAALTVSLASSTRLRKLRDAPAEDIVGGTHYEAKLRREYERIHPAPAWAASARKKLRSDKREEAGRKRRRSSGRVEGEALVPEGEGNAVEDEGGIDDLLTSTNGILREEGGPGARLEKGRIGIERLRDANQSAKAEGEIKALEFHPSPRVPVMMAASTDRRVRLFNIDGHTNPLLQTLHIPELPVTHAAFHPGGSSILLTGPRPFYYTFDLQSGQTLRSPRGLWGTSFTSSHPAKSADMGMERCAFDPTGDMLAVAGRSGAVHLVDWRTGGAQVVGSVKMNAGVRALWWSRAPGGEGELMTLGDDAEVYMWDVGERRCVRRWKEDGGYGTTVMAGDSSGQYLGIGSKTGLVNVYGEDASISNAMSNPKVLKTVQNLTTSISTLRFNHDSQLLAMASATKKDQMRLVHLPSLTAYSNWPTSSTPLGHVTAIDFSAGSEYIAIGNNRGRVLLYQLTHFVS